MEPEKAQKSGCHVKQSQQAECSAAQRYISHTFSGGMLLPGRMKSSHSSRSVSVMCATSFRTTSTVPNGEVVAEVVPAKIVGFSPLTVRCRAISARSIPYSIWNPWRPNMPQSRISWPIGRMYPSKCIGNWRKSADTAGCRLEPRRYLLNRGRYGACTLRSSSSVFSAAISSVTTGSASRA